MLSFNSALNFKNIKESFEIDKRLQINNVWDLDIATSIYKSLSKDIKYKHAYALKGQNFELTEQDIRGLSQSKLQQFTNSIQKEASQGIGFLYGRQLIKSDDIEQPEVIKSVKTFLNSDFVIQKVRDISGHFDINMASVKATRYMPGNFLTRHNDINADENRKLAYVLGFTPEWHPDWGGLLQFYEKNGTPRDAWSPVFNSMAIFDVNHIHSVTYIAPFALAPRYAIAGFFRAD